MPKFRLCQFQTVKALCSVKSHFWGLLLVTVGGATVDRADFGGAPSRPSSSRGASRARFLPRKPVLNVAIRTGELSSGMFRKPPPRNPELEALIEQRDDLVIQISLMMDSGNADTQDLRIQRDRLLRLDLDISRHRRRL
jgi:hypothetical protein